MGIWTAEGRRQADRESELVTPLYAEILRLREAISDALHTLPIDAFSGDYWDISNCEIRDAAKILIDALPRNWR